MRKHFKCSCSCCENKFEKKQLFFIKLVNLNFIFILSFVTTSYIKEKKYFYVLCIKSVKNRLLYYKNLPLMTLFCVLFFKWKNREYKIYILNKKCIRIWSIFLMIQDWRLLTRNWNQFLFMLLWFKITSQWYPESGNPSYF